MTGGQGEELSCIVTIGWGRAQLLSQQACLSEAAARIVAAEDAAGGLSHLRELSPELALLWEDASPSDICRFIQTAKALSPKTTVVVVSAARPG